MQSYDFNTGNQGTIAAAGDEIYFESGTVTGSFDDRISIRPERGGSEIRLRPGQGFKFTERSQTWRISAAAPGATVQGVIVIGEGIFKNSRVAGAVEIVDTGKKLTEQGRTYSGNRSAAAAAGLFGFVAFWNPAASGIMLAVRNLVIVSDTAGSAALGRVTADINAGDNTRGQNKYLGGAQSTSVWKSATDANPTGAAGWGFTGHATVVIGANLPFNYPQTNPILIPPGFGLCVRSPAVNTLISAIADIEEYAI